MKGAKEKCLEAGMDDYIAKPLRREDLMSIVEKWVGLRSGLGRESAEYQSKSKSVITEEDAPMDFERAVEEFEGDEEFLMEVLEGFLKNVRNQIGTIRRSISDVEAEVVRREAHSIKGGAANLTANDLSGIAFKLENIAKSGNLEGSSDALERFEKQFHRLEAYAGNR